MSIRDGAFWRCKLIATVSELIPDSIQSALRMFFQPIKNDDPRLDFYTMYKRETMEYDTDYMQKHNEDLNTTLIFVRFCAPFTHSADCTLRLVCSLPSVLPSSSTSSRSSSQIPPNGPKPTSERFFSPSTDPLLPAKTPPLPQCGRVPPRRSSPHWISYMRVC